MQYGIINNKLFKCEPVSGKVKIYTCIKGEIYEGNLVRETLQGYVVRGGTRIAEHIVVKRKLRVGWILDEQKPFYTVCSFVEYSKARLFAKAQILSMENYYNDRLVEIQKIKSNLNK